MISEALKVARLYGDYTQSEMATQVGISQSHLSEIESGKKKPTLDLIEKYASALDLRPWQLMMFADELEENPTLRKGRLLIAGQALKILERMKPNERNSAQA